MKKLSLMAGVLFALAGLSLCKTAQAQFSIPTPVSQENGGQDRITNSSVSIYPFAHVEYAVGGFTGSHTGVVIAGDTSLRLSDKFRLGLGGYANVIQYDTPAPVLYEFHANTFLNRNFGVQVGSLIGPHYTAYEAFGLLKTSSANSGKHGWAAQLGLGVIIDPSVKSGSTSTDFDGFLTGSYNLSERLALNVSLLHRAQVLHTTEVAIGIGTKF